MVMEFTFALEFTFSSQHCYNPKNGNVTVHTVMSREVISGFYPF